MIFFFKLKNLKKNVEIMLTGDFKRSNTSMLKLKIHSESVFSKLM